MGVSESDKRPSTDEEGYKGKVCVVCSCDGETGLFILDLNSADSSTEFIPIPPALRFHEDLGILSFCVLGTKLYVIGGDDPDFTLYPTKPWMCEYDLDLDLGRQNSLIDRNGLKNCRVSDMNATKWSPMAIPTPDGRILVYSNNIMFASPEPSHADFEVYDPKLKQWQILPPLHLVTGDNRDVWLIDKSGKWNAHPRGGGLLSRNRCWNHNFGITNVCTFMSGSSTFLLTLQTGLMFTLNLDSLEEGWQAYYDPFVDEVTGAEIVVGDEFVVAEPFLVTPSWVKARSRDAKQLFPSVLPPDTIFGLFTRPDYKIIVLECGEGREYCFTCTVTSGHRGGATDDGFPCGDDGFPFLICSIRKHEIATDGGALITTTDSFRFCLTMGDYLAMLIQNVFLMSFESSLRTKRLKSS